MLTGRVLVYALVGSLQWMGYPTFGPTLVSIPNNTLPLAYTSKCQTGYEKE